jgi:putative methionine-R-sulfoxide reductase with GAF domain
MNSREAPEPVLIEVVREEAATDDPIDRRALRIAELVRTHMGRRRVGIHRIDGDEVASLAWSGPAARAYPRLPADRGLTGASIASRSSVVSNDVAIIPILREGRVVGALYVEDERTGAFDHRQLGLLEQIAGALTTLY